MHSIIHIPAEKVRALAADVDVMAYPYADYDPVALISLAAYYMEREAWVHKVIDFLEVRGFEFVPEDSCESDYYAPRLSFEFKSRLSVVWKGVPFRVYSLDLIIKVDSEFTKRMISLALAKDGNGLLDGWDGPAEEMTEIFSKYGSVSIQCAETV